MIDYLIFFFTNYSSKELPPQLTNTSQPRLVTLPYSPHTTCNEYRETRYSALGVVHANVGQNVTPPNPSLGLFLYHFLHTMSLWGHESIHNNTNNQQTPPPWWWSCSPLQRRGFDDTTPPEGRAALRMFFSRPLSKDFVWFIKLM